MSNVPSLSERTAAVMGPHPQTAAFPSHTDVDWTIVACSVSLELEQNSTLSDAAVGTTMTDASAGHQGDVS